MTEPFSAPNRPFLRKRGFPMFLLRFIHRVFIHPAFLIPVTLMVGAFWAATNPDVAELLNAYALKVWKPEAAPIVFRVITIVLFSLAFGFFVDAFYGSRRKPVDPAAAEARRVEAERVSRENARREAADYQAWVVERLNPWMHLLEDTGELVRSPEIEARFAEKKADTRREEMQLQDLWMMQWLVQNAQQLSGVDGRDNPAKTHQFLEHAFRIAGERDAWDQMQGIAGSQIVLSRFFRGQARDLTTRYGGARDMSNRFTRFTGWAVAKPFPA